MSLRIWDILSQRFLYASVEVGGTPNAEEDDEKAGKKIETKTTVHVQRQRHVAGVQGQARSSRRTRSQNTHDRRGEDADVDEAAVL